MNIPRLPGLEGFLLGLIGSTGGPRVTRLTRLLTVGDRRALAAHLERLAATPGLVRLVPSHGPIVSERAGEVLREVALRCADQLVRPFAPGPRKPVSTAMFT